MKASLITFWQIECLYCSDQRKWKQFYGMLYQQFSYLHYSVKCMRARLFRKMPSFSCQSVTCYILANLKPSFLPPRTQLWKIQKTEGFYNRSFPNICLVFSTFVLQYSPADIADMHKCCAKHDSFSLIWKRDLLGLWESVCMDSANSIPALMPPVPIHRPFNSFSIKVIWFLENIFSVIAEHFLLVCLLA